jgi:hypothetical protein
MRVNKFSFLVLSLVFCACSILVSAKETKLKVTDQLSIQKVSCQQNSNQLFQSGTFTQLNSYQSETINVNNFNPSKRTRNTNHLPLLGFAMPPPIFAFQIQPLELFDGNKGELKYDWACVTVCMVWCTGAGGIMCANTCLNACSVN